ncbi:MULTISPECIES: YtxH domain-containing protein [Saccharibacillus]|uniref:YtxH domain-containing protein n=1 Tax=Saccharibacillus TaxID=456492 RepID=UPI00123960BE|nr:YtxH domain-containing protein [Saccharibacillus sp. WB 17]MWJ32072.1 hypothetical protein [Saccharibacillus sp. WB 17]
MDETTKKRAARIVAGTLTGAGVAWLLTSRKGADARQKLHDLAVQTKDLGVELGHGTAEKTRDLIALGREVSSDEDWKDALETLEIEPEPEANIESPQEPAQDDHILSDKEAAAADIVPFPQKLPDLR